MDRTNDLRILGIQPLAPPRVLKEDLPITEESAQTVVQSRKAVDAIIDHSDPRMLAVVGPCSIHDRVAAIDYANRLNQLRREIEDRVFVVMRVYFEKPRTTIGWKGLINDPDLNGSHQISKGLGVARGLLCAVTGLGLPIACEMLDPITVQYLSDMVSWGAIGARTTESQPHREMASGLSFPVGFKNGTDGNLQIAVHAIEAATHPHSFLGIDREGRTAIIETIGNPDGHMVLRGGGGKPNYDAESIAKAEALLAKGGLQPAIMVDCSHANAFKDHNRQEEVLTSAMDQIAKGNRSICSLMIESNIGAGNQPLSDDISRLQYGVSITDKCIDWPTTERLLRQTHKRLKELGGRTIS